MKTKEEYIDALGRMEEVYYNFDGCISAMNIFKEGVNLLTELVNEHFEKKVETNLEYYFEYLSKLNMSDFALIDGKVTQCLGTGCSECDFNGDCIEGKFKWLKQPYKKPTYKLTKFEFDLIQTYRDCHESCKLSEFKQLIELKDKGHFKNINGDELIKDILANCEVVKNAES